MYLHRYPHIQSIHPYINRLVHMNLHIPRQPPENIFGGEISQLFSRHYNLRSPKSQMRGKSNLNYLCAYDCKRAFPSWYWKPTWDKLLGVVAVKLDLMVSPSHDGTTETLQGRSCSFMFSVQ